MGCAWRMDSVEDEDNQYIIAAAFLPIVGPAGAGYGDCGVVAGLPSVTATLCDTSLAGEAAPHDTTLTALPSRCQLPPRFWRSPAQSPKLKRRSTTLLLCLHRCLGGCCWGDQQRKQGSLGGSRGTFREDT